MLSGSFSRRNQQAKGSIKMELFEAAWLCKAWSMLKYACFSIQDCEVVQASLLFSKHWGGACMQGHSTLICSKAVHVLWETLENTVRQNSLSLRCSAVRYVLLKLIYPNTSFFIPVCILPPYLLQMKIGLAWRVTNSNKYLHKNYSFAQGICYTALAPEKGHCFTEKLTCLPEHVAFKYYCLCQEYARFLAKMEGQ